MKRTIAITESQLRRMTGTGRHIPDDILYAAIVLTSESMERLLEHVNDYFPDWTDYRTVCHHSTIFFHNNVTDELYEWCEENEGKSHRMVATGYGISNKAFAVMVKSNTPTANKTKHITVAVNNGESGKPVDSNSITEWHPMEPVELEGTVEIFRKKQTAVPDEPRPVRESNGDEGGNPLRQRQMEAYEEAKAICLEYLKQYYDPKTDKRRSPFKRLQRNTIELWMKRMDNFGRILGLPTYRDYSDMFFNGNHQGRNQGDNQTNENTAMKKKQTIKLNESQLRNIVSKAVKRILHESEKPPKGWVKFETVNGPLYMDPDGKMHVPGENGSGLIPAQKTPYMEKRLTDKQREWAFNDAVSWIEDGFDNFNDWYDFNSDMADWNDYDSETDEGDGFFNRNTRYQLKDIFNQALKACGHTSFYTDIPEYETED